MDGSTCGMAAFVAAGGVVGAAIGSLSALSLDDALLQRLFAVVLIVVALRMLIPRRTDLHDRGRFDWPECRSRTRVAACPMRPDPSSGSTSS